MSKPLTLIVCTNITDGLAELRRRGWTQTHHHKGIKPCGAEVVIITQHGAFLGYRPTELLIVGDVRQDLIERLVARMPENFKRIIQETNFA